MTRSFKRFGDRRLAPGRQVDDLANVGVVEFSESCIDLSLLALVLRTGRPGPGARRSVVEVRTGGCSGDSPIDTFKVV